MSTPSVQHLSPRKSVPLGELAASQARLKSRQALQRIGKPFAPWFAGEIGGSSLSELLSSTRKSGHGITIDAACALEWLPERTSSRKVPRTFARASLRTLGFSEPVHHATLHTWAKNANALVEPLHALELLARFADGEVGDFARLLTPPLLVGDQPYVFTLCGNGPTLYAFPRVPGETYDLDTEFIFQIES